MKVILAEKRGFCYGVKKAVKRAEEAPQKYPLPICTFGPLIHNTYQIRRLKEAGISAISSPGAATGGTVIIRTHGISDGIRNQLKKQNVRVLDATCPFVKKIQHKVRTLSGKGYDLVIVGEKDHPEVKALVSYAQGPIRVVNSVREAAAIPAGWMVAVVSQSTQAREDFVKITELIG